MRIYIYLSRYLTIKHFEPYHVVIWGFHSDHRCFSEGLLLPLELRRHMSEQSVLCTFNSLHLCTIWSLGFICYFLLDIAFLVMLNGTGSIWQHGSALQAGSTKSDSCMQVSCGPSPYVSASSSIFSGKSASWHRWGQGRKRATAAKEATLPHCDKQPFCKLRCARVLIPIVIQNAKMC